MTIKLRSNIKSISSLLLLILLITFSILLLLLSNRSATHSMPLSSSYHTENFTIELTSPSEEHFALQNSDFVLQISPSADVDHSKPLSDPSINLINPVITLQMLHMNCGTVTSIPHTSSEATYHTEAAPLMKGIWVATATFQLEENKDQTIVLSYQFEVL